ncbi:hypothetical protein EDC30_10953 [Paucimonas lemoignei]|uniref:Uncharacterized protein n=1 Tax=Paucimonas lemoignei TaxID=29443 RepID=A0A4R3HSV0_PAULE|nr:hypothetical protein [Paucimonas lemoignei]TCS35754.1 hypothetical protein EDC30_10953 [Paucimonas lemoignei]
MSESKKMEQKPSSGKEEMNSSNLPSSQGDSPKEMIPKDISPTDAAWADRSERKITSRNQEEHTEALLDEAVEDTFPASDPVAEISQTHASEQHSASPIDEEEELLDDAIEMTFPASDPIAVPSDEEIVYERKLRQEQSRRAGSPGR